MTTLKNERQRNSASSREPLSIGIGMVGYAFMGAAHSQAWRTVGRVFDLPLKVRMVAVAGRDAVRVKAAAQRFGWDSFETDWRRLIERPDIELVDVCAPGSSHCEIAIAALRAGKHVLCEKPLANTLAEAEEMTHEAQCAAERGVRTMVGFNYRRVPAIALARQMIAAGQLGVIRHVRAVYLQDWIVDPQFPLVWRLRAEEAGSGALGDIGAHIVDVTQYLLGDRIAGVSALTETFIKERPLPGATSDGGRPARSGKGRGAVTVDDAVVFIARFAGGALATFEATRFATGRKNALRVEINGELGSLAFDLEACNELQFYDRSSPSGTRGFTRILVTEPEHPYMAAWWPPGHLIGYEHSFTHEMRDLLEAVAENRDPQPSFRDGLQVQRVLDAVARSAAETSQWIHVRHDDVRSATTHLV
jgi:predicted dehydrogenase